MKNNQKIDIVIPVAPKDILKLSICVESIVANSLTPIQNIYIISNSDRPLYDFNLNQKVIWVNEKNYPFSLEKIERILKKKNGKYNHGSWYYQQLLKFYVFEVILDLQPHTLILDSDLFFSKKINFLNDDGKAILASGYPFKWLLNTREYSSQNNHSHIDFAKRFIPNWEPVNSFSGMHHHMVFQKEIIKNIFAIIEETHHQEFWQAFVDNLELDKWNAASEYVAYYHFVMKLYPNSVITRHLKTCDFISDAKENNYVLEKAKQTMASRDFHAVGCHSFIDLRSRLKTMDYIPAKLKEKMLSSGRMAFQLILDNGMLQINSV